MKKGFTLIELLAVMVVIGIISSITMVYINRVVRADRESAYNTQISFIETKAKEWSVSHNSEVIGVDNDPYYLTINKLISDGFIDNDKLLNPITGAELTGCVKISYDTNNDGYKYRYDDYSECGTNIYYVDVPTYSANANRTLITANSYVTGTILEDKYCIYDETFNTCRSGMKNAIYDTLEACEEANTGYDAKYGNYQCGHFDSIKVDNGRYLSSYKQIMHHSVFLKIRINDEEILDTSICFMYNDSPNCIPVIENKEYVNTYDLSSVASAADSHADFDMLGVVTHTYNLSDNYDRFYVLADSYDNNGIEIDGNYGLRGIQSYFDSCRLYGQNPPMESGMPFFKIGLAECVYK